ncbi:hypothetical protein C8J57DRAFT_1540053 [Mycena rebaudengoi]|nr:hypothetical protein C8J57DRAFT_1540053 [Mycena rebaudengoi]
MIRAPHNATLILAPQLIPSLPQQYPTLFTRIMEVSAGKFHLIGANMVRMEAFIRQVLLVQRYFEAQTKAKKPEERKSWATADA